tara:strand:- start:69193 stop:70164 length:972 start_codon:yes stop_codon:yes gene_type:complete
MIIKAILLLLVGFRINAQNLELPIGSEYNSIQIKLNRHDVKIQESGAAKIQFVGMKDKGNWNFRKDNGVLIVEEKDYDSKLFHTPTEGVKEGPKERLVLKVPALPLFVSGNDLDVTLDNLRNTVKLVVFKGSVKGFKTQGELRVFLNSGEVSLDAHSAPLFLNGSQVKFGMKNSSSDIKVNNYSGTVVLEKNTGHSSIFNYQGGVTLKDVTGSSQIELMKGTVAIAQSQGRHDIVTDEVNIDLKATKESDFNVKMKNGKLNYGTSGVGGVWLSLNSKEGDIYLPSPMKPQKVKAETFYKGRTSGEKSAARLEAKTVNAAIIVR